MKYLVHILFLFFLNSFLTFGQSELEEKEIVLNRTLLDLRAAKTDAEIEKQNRIFKKEMEAFLKLDGVFKYQFKHLKTVAVLDSPDQLVRIINWNLEYTDMSYSFCAFVMRWDEDKKKVKNTELVDNLDPYSPKPEGTIDPKDWYGCLYYKIVPFERNNKIEYLLLGWDGATTGSNFKFIDVLVLNGNGLKLGSPVFKGKSKVSKRVIFEYSEKSVMALNFEDKRERIVFDHLSPESQSLAGITSYYVPDMSYDSYNYADELWVLNEDVIALNSDDNNDKREFYAVNEKTGKIEKHKLNNSWIDPTDENNSTDAKHVARTPESEAQRIAQEKEELLMPKVKKKSRRDRRNPSGLSVTTGKYKSKKRKKFD
jgi:hypothetical protein